MMDAFGHPLGTTYRQNADGSFVLDGDGAPVVDMMGMGVITTLTQDRISTPATTPTTSRSARP